MDITALAYMESFFMALADKTRLRLLNLMRDGEVCVGVLTEVLGDSQPKISRHLAYLRAANLVRPRRDGKWMHYGIIEPEDSGENGVLRAVLAWLDEQPEMRAERARCREMHRLPEPRTHEDGRLADAGPTLQTEATIPVGEEPSFTGAGHNELDEFLL